MLNDAPTLLDTSGVIPGQSVNITGDKDSLIAHRYRLLRSVGSGGMGNVYLANDLVLERQVAIKTVRSELSGNEELRTRIKRECRLHAAIGAHANIVTLYDTIEENGHIYLVMEYFAGQTLAARLTAGNEAKRLPLHLALDIVRQILQALTCIHDRDIVHRDIKTSNILLQKQDDGQYLAKLTDFGIAQPDVDAAIVTRLTSLDTQGPGTPVYMAPERIDPQTFGSISVATDLYAVGIILYEMLTGSPPFTGSMTEVFTGHLLHTPNLDVLPADLPVQFAQVLTRSLAKQPAERFQAAGDFLAALAGIREDASPLPERAAFCEATVLAVEEYQTVSPIPDATVLSSDLSHALPLGHTSPALLRKWWWAIPLMIGLVMAGVYQLSRQPTVSASPPAPNETLSSTPSPSTGTTAPAPSPPSTEKTEPVEAGAALQALEQARQQNTVKPPPPVVPAQTVSSPPQGTSAPVIRRASEWRVTENHTRKIQ
jgi:serine/threonine-protein kinase